MAKAKKKKKIDKSMIAFDVKAYDPIKQDLEALWQDIIKFKKDGLTWNKNFQLVDIAFGMQKLRMSMVVEDDKIGVDELYEEI